MKDKIYVAFYEHGMDEELLNFHIYSRVIIPEVIEVRRKLMENPFAAWAPTDDENPYRWISITQDGANGQVKAIENSLHNMCVEANHNIIWGKFSAGASMPQAPNDKGVMHHTLHNLFKTSNFRNEEPMEPNTEPWNVVKNILKNSVDPNSYNTVWKCLLQSHAFLTRAFNGVALNSAFHKSGMFVPPHGKFSPPIILSQCPHFATLSEDNAHWFNCLVSIKYLTENCTCRSKLSKFCMKERGSITPHQEKEKN